MRFGSPSLFALTSLLFVSGCSRHTTSSGSPTNFNQEEPNPVATVVPAKPTPTPPIVITPTPTPTPTTATETPIPCTRGQLDFFAKLGVVSAGKVDAKGFNVSHGLVGTSVSIRQGILGYESLGIGWDRYDIQATDLSIEDATVDFGRVAYSNSRDNRNQGNSFFALPVKGKFVDSAPVLAAARTLRDRLALFPQEGVVTRTCGPKTCEVLLKGVHSKFNKFLLDPSIVKKGDDVRVSVPNGSTPVIFLKGGLGTVFTNNFVTAPFETLWVAGDQTKRVSLNWLTLYGTLIAPEADLQLEQTLIMGRVIVNSVTMPSCSDDACVTVDSQERIDSSCL